MPLSLAPVPPSLKSIQHYLKTATEHEARDPVVVYWCRIAALQSGLALDKSSKVGAVLQHYVLLACLGRSQPA